MFRRHTQQSWLYAFATLKRFGSSSSSLGSGQWTDAIETLALSGKGAAAKRDHEHDERKREPRRLVASTLAVGLGRVVREPTHGTHGRLFFEGKHDRFAAAPDEARALRNRVQKRRVFTPPGERRHEVGQRRRESSDTALFAGSGLPFYLDPHFHRSAPFSPA